MDIQIAKEKAWIGDAVLALFARQWILEQTDVVVTERAETFKAMTSNQFLSALGQPTLMEAEIGVVYEKDGLQAAFDFVEEKFLPVFKKQRRNKKRVGSWRGKR